MNQPTHWWGTDESFARQVLAEMRQRFDVTEQAPESFAGRCFDTFDWRFWEAGFFLVESRRSRSLILQRFQDRVIECEVSLTGASDTYLWRDVPAGPLQDRVRSLCGIRAALATGRFAEERQRFDLRNEDGKTVCRIVFERAVAGGSSDAGRVVSAGFRLDPLKGYETEAGVVATCLAEMGCRPVTRTAHPAVVAFRAVGREPGDYSSKASLQLPEGILAEEACRRIHLASLTMAERNLAGIAADYDPEFLHDFRVALRRSRSALSLVKGVFPHKAELRFNRSLAKVQRATNRLRDLDVHLLERETFDALLPPELHAGLDSLFQQLALERAQAFRRCCRFLERDSTRNALREWRAFLECPSEAAAKSPPCAQKPALTVGRKLLRKRFHRILRDGRAIDSKTPDKALHALRLQCKKLRYLLEFFGSLLPAGESAFLISRFRKLQNILGRFNDLCVQEAWVRRRLEAAESGTATSSDLAASLGGLLSELRRLRVAERAKFGRAFARIDKPGFIRRAEKLLAGKDGKK